MSALDGQERIFAYRKLPRVGIFATTGVDTADIRLAWLRTMSRHLIFGLPATAAMVGLCLIALRRTRREAAANEMLRQEIARREATEDALRQSQKMEAVGRLTGGIAHDFNNLLTAIIGNLDLALRRLDGEERVRGWLANSRKAAERAATLVHRLLAFSRQHPLEVKSVDINRLVQGMSDLLGRTIGETVTIETVLAGGLWKAAIDPNQLENTILNLAVNARDAMPDGGRLTIETANCHLDEHYIGQTGAEIGPGQYVMVAVSDSGSRHELRGDEPRVRAVLHHQAARRRHRPRAVAGLRLCQAVRRTYPHLYVGPNMENTGRFHPRPVASGRSANSPRRPGWRAAPALSLWNDPTRPPATHDDRSARAARYYVARLSTVLAPRAKAAQTAPSPWKRASSVPCRRRPRRTSSGRLAWRRCRFRISRKAGLSGDRLQRCGEPRPRG